MCHKCRRLTRLPFLVHGTRRLKFYDQFHGVGRSDAYQCLRAVEEDIGAIASLAHADAGPGEDSPNCGIGLFQGRSGGTST